MERCTDIQILNAQDKRVETGAIQFGDDWPGVFIRGDNAGWFAFSLKAILEHEAQKLEPHHVLLLKQLHATLSGAIVGPASDLIKLQIDPMPEVKV